MKPVYATVAAANDDKQRSQVEGSLMYYLDMYWGSIVLETNGSTA